MENGSVSVSLAMQTLLLPILLYIFLSFLLMDDYQLFWSDQLSKKGPSQFVLDWDTFIHNFSKAISTHAFYQLNKTQKQYIKAKIDPQNRNEVYKSGFLLFAKNYWSIPSNRTNLFKMKMNLTNVLPRFTLMTQTSQQKIDILFCYLSQNNITKYLRYRCRQNKLFTLDQKFYEVDEIKVNQKGFITIGSADNNDIKIQDCLFVNKNHIKLFSTSKLVKKPKKTNYFQQKQDKFSEVVEWFVRDTSKSNRLSFVLDNPYKYVILKPNMVISFGLTSDYQLRVQQINNSKTEFSIPKNHQNQINALLNSDRIDMFGEIDPNTPLKTTLDLNFKEITAKQVEQMYKQKQFYPTEQLLQTKSSKKDGASITFEIFNKRNMQSKLITLIDPLFSLGRSKKCKQRINDITIREQQLLFKCINGYWLINNPTPGKKTSFEVNQPSIFLASKGNLEESKVSNRMQIFSGYPYVLRGKRFQMEVVLTEAQQQEEEQT